MSSSPRLVLGLKTDAVEYRYSYEWLFDLMASEGLRYAQLGSFTEMFLLPDEYFHYLRQAAESRGVKIMSLFTAHRELGGLFREDGPGWDATFKRLYRRHVEVGSLIGAKHVGGNPGAVLRDRMHFKAEGTRRYVAFFKEMMHYAHQKGIEFLNAEPMSCLAEPPTLPQEMRDMGEELAAYHAQHPADTCRFGFCTDIAHGYADADMRIKWDHMQLLDAALPWTSEIHLKNTDKIYNSTFGFSDAERAKGIIEIEPVKELLRRRAAELPVTTMVGYLELGGPKVGRDYTDNKVEEALRASIRYLKEVWPTDANDGATSAKPPAPIVIGKPMCGVPPVQVSPSLMCADMCHLEKDIRRLEAVGCEWLHFDIMDANFVPNMPMGLVTIEQLRPKTKLPFDVHLMVMDNDLLVRNLAKLGVQQVSVHAESCRHLDRTLTLIRDSGMKAGVALNPATPLDAMRYVLERLDFVLLMTVNPGFAGQKLVPSAIRKIADCRAMLRSAGIDIPIEIDGNVSFENIPKMVAAGGDILVAGTSSLYHKDGTFTQNAAKMKEAIAAGLAERSG